MYKLFRCSKMAIRRADEPRSLDFKLLLPEGPRDRLGWVNAKAAERYTRYTHDAITLRFCAGSVRCGEPCHAVPSSSMRSTPENMSIPSPLALPLLYYLLYYNMRRL
jgi:hypothetical protein